MAKAAEALALLEKAISTPHGVEVTMEGDWALLHAKRLRHKCYEIRRARPEFQCLRLKVQQIYKGAKLLIEREEAPLQKETSL